MSVKVLPPIEKKLIKTFVAAATINTPNQSKAAWLTPTGKFITGFSEHRHPSGMVGHTVSELKHKRGWVRVVADPDFINVDPPKKITKAQKKQIRNLKNRFDEFIYEDGTSFGDNFKQLNSAVSLRKGRSKPVKVSRGRGKK